MSYKRIILILLIMTLAIGSTGCIKKGGLKKDSRKDDELEIVGSEKQDFEITDEDGMRETVLYFKDSLGLLVPVMRKLPWNEGIAKSAIENMIDSPELRKSVSSIGLEPVIPTGTEILGMAVNEENGICKIDFSNDLLSYDTEKEEEGLIKGIVYTLTEFPTINEVQVLVEGKSPEVLKHGTNAANPIKREDINLTGEVDDNRSKVVVYYKKDNSENDFEYFVPVTIPTLAPMPNIYTALEVLWSGH